MRVLLVEDEDPKRQHLLKFCDEVFESIQIELAASVRGAIDHLRVENVDLVLLDMSLPTFDIAAKERGGRPQGAGGIEVIRFLDMMEMSVPIIVVTAYPAIQIDGRQQTLDEVDVLLRGEHPRLYRGLVYFNSVYGGWRQELETAMRNLGAS
jgi:CheY-like chemotaxis protein